MILNKGRWKAAVWHVAFKVLSISFHGMHIFGDDYSFKDDARFTINEIFI